MKFATVLRAHALTSLLAAVSCSDGGKSDSGIGTAGTSGTGGAAGMNAPSAGAGGAAAVGGGRASGAAGSTPGASGSGGGAGSAGAGASAAGAGGSSAGSGGAAGRTASAGAGAAAGVGGTTAGAGAAGGGGGAAGGGASPMMNLFVSSSTSTTANLNGLSGADMRCQTLAEAVGAGGKTWRAYLSAENPATNAADRIGPGPYYNAQGTMIAADKASLHARAGDATLFLTEKGAKVNGQWIGSPTPNEHDILTGTQRDGTLATGMTCSDWTATSGMSQVGHSDGLGPNQATSGMYSFWNSVHTGQCGNTAPGGGAGRIYCFVGP
ncbi:MAG TPA: hypothetical protein VFG30_39155 [Polyangiales bacterium]|nr:hypothetical protein [Polyangiales bacterium]